MDMADLMELLELRQGNDSDEKFANRMDLRGSTFWRYKNRKSAIDMEAREKMIQFFAERHDAEMVGALLAYRTGVTLSEPDLSELGRVFLQSSYQAVALASSH
jgi:hypothetical protein